MTLATFYFILFHYDCVSDTCIIISNILCPFSSCLIFLLCGSLRIIIGSDIATAADTSAIPVVNTCAALAAFGLLILITSLIGEAQVA